MRGAAKLIILGFLASSATANEGNPTLLVDDNGNNIVTNRAFRLKTSIETQNLTDSSGNTFVTNDGETIIATTHI